MATAIRTEDLTKSYGSTDALVSLDLEVAQGDVLGYLGPNGAGKTTTIRTMLDLLRPTMGNASLLGLDSHRDVLEIHRRVGYLPGDFSAYRRMTGRAYLQFFAALRGLGPSSFEGLADRLACDLEPRISSLSHGNVQKLGLIQALMHEPDLLILDEPTQGLDPLVQREFHDLVLETSARGGTVFLSSHVLPEVERTCDRIGIIDDGRLIDVEDVGDLQAKVVRVVEFHFTHPVPSDAFANVPGVTDLEVHSDVMRCTVRGPVDALLKAVARFEVVDLQSRQPGLEELFLEYYRDRREESN
jgi:ABC-2 type transport system ATP-binding protein